MKHISTPRVDGYPLMVVKVLAQVGEAVGPHSRLAIVMTSEGQRLGVNASATGEIADIRISDGEIIDHPGTIIAINETAKVTRLAIEHDDAERAARAEALEVHERKKQNPEPEPEPVSDTEKKTPRRKDISASLRERVKPETKAAQGIFPLLLCWVLACWLILLIGFPILANAKFATTQAILGIGLGLFPTVLIWRRLRRVNADSNKPGRPGYVILLFLVCGIFLATFIVARPDAQKATISAYIKKLPAAVRLFAPQPRNLDLAETFVTRDATWVFEENEWPQLDGGSNYDCRISLMSNEPSLLEPGIDITGFTWILRNKIRSDNYGAITRVGGQLRIHIAESRWPVEAFAGLDEKPLKQTVTLGSGIGLRAWSAHIVLSNNVLKGHVMADNHWSKGVWMLASQVNDVLNEAVPLDHRGEAVDGAGTLSVTLGFDLMTGRRPHGLTSGETLFVFDEYAEEMTKFGNCISTRLME